MVNQAVLLSLWPQWVEPIMKGEKIYEVRKRAPLLTTPYKVYIYCTLREPRIEWKNHIFNGTVCGEFTCTSNLTMKSPWQEKTQGTCLTAFELAKYASYGDLVYMQIENPKMYDKPLMLSDFGLERAPMSWQYVEELQNV